MFALRAARAATGRPAIARFEGSYHGTHDGVVAGPGIPDPIRDLTLILPWGDIAAVEAALSGREAEVAAIIVEPVQGAGGLRPAEPAFLADLREYTRRAGMLLIFDEIICFRIGPNGAQGVYGVEPDLTTLGKIIGGGYPLAAFGGRADVMDRFDARRDGALVHGGTFNGNPVAAAAGLATLRTMTPAAYATLAAIGERLETRIGEVLAAGDVPGRVTRVASLFEVRLDAVPPADLYLGLLLEGFQIAPRGMGGLSTPVTLDDVDDFAEAVGRVGPDVAVHGRGLT
jgi:glutamate-1-semialdehyde 2,1-aminomutase